MAHPVETIAAVATAAGRGGIGIVRLSGPAVPAIAQALIRSSLRPRYAQLAVFRDALGEAIDQGLALLFPAPHSYTGEDVLELHGHGGPRVMDLLLERVCAMGARLAHPGEFSQRAFLNGKLDLAQAEAVADLIDSATGAAVRGAMRSLRGEFSRRVGALDKGLLALRAHVEAAIDFPEEEEDYLADPRIAQRLDTLVRELETLVQETTRGCLLREGLNVVLAGAPNAGKSSLFNALVGDARAIVTEVPGTTRDLVSAGIELDGLAVQFTDTAGLRVAGDAIEREGVRRAEQAMARADQVLMVIDDMNERPVPAAPGACVLRVYNKIDLSGRPPGAFGKPPAVAVSARSGAGLDALRGQLLARVGFADAGGGEFLARRRHLDALERAGQALAAGAEVFAATTAGELLAEELRHAHDALGEITGVVRSEDLLGQIFSSFCLGK